MILSRCWKIQVKFAVCSTTTLSPSLTRISLSTVPTFFLFLFLSHAHGTYARDITPFEQFHRLVVTVTVEEGYTVFLEQRYYVSVSGNDLSLVRAETWVVDIEPRELRIETSSVR